jgi:hypothetical protein
VPDTTGIQVSGCRVVASSRDFRWIVLSRTLQLPKKKTSREKKCKIVPCKEEGYFFFLAAGFAAAFFAGFLAAAFFAAAIRGPPPTGKGYIFSQSAN